ncbi:hypothetical protein J1N35_014281 [Gossypium stocksii]|uniref:Uncharacterized protein n=1 Tax=Gossypium stocksii TaxID=47602 RepID=A0A9D3VTU2_9ROSI|nr:hypothetical protein J1N35_014281 [Gossypium stocksii]
MSLNLSVPSSCSSETTLATSPLDVDGPASMGQEVSEDVMGGAAPVEVEVSPSVSGAHVLSSTINMQPPNSFTSPLDQLGCHRIARN